VNSESPYRITGPAIISFSGGRTSAFMLHQILEAHGGRLPDDVKVAFANTGKERPETLRFVHECETRWNVPVAWLEWRAREVDANRESLKVWLDEKDPERRLVSEEAFEVVGYNSASRNGEPFEAVIALKQRLPNWRERWCTAYLKVDVLIAYARSLGLDAGQYTEVVGLRHDEGHRILKGMANAEKYGRRMAYPLSKAKATKANVMAFWKSQPFDLQLQPWEGNCDLCFLKGRGLLKRIIRDDPKRADWWMQQEGGRAGFFSSRDDVKDLLEEVRRSPTLFDDDLTEEFDTECSSACSSENTEAFA